MPRAPHRSGSKRPTPSAGYSTSPNAPRGDQPCRWSTGVGKHLTPFWPKGGGGVGPHPNPKPSPSPGCSAQPTKQWAGPGSVPPSSSDSSPASTAHTASPPSPHPNQSLGGNDGEPGSAEWNRRRSIGVSQALCCACRFVAYPMVHPPERHVALCAMAGRDPTKHDRPPMARSTPPPGNGQLTGRRAIGTLATPPNDALKDTETLTVFWEGGRQFLDAKMTRGKSVNFTLTNCQYRALGLTSGQAEVRISATRYEGWVGGGHPPSI